MTQPTLNDAQKEVIKSFEALDAKITALTLPVRQAVELADAFGRCARAVDMALQIQTGLRPDGEPPVTTLADVSQLAPEAREMAEPAGPAV